MASPCILASKRSPRRKSCCKNYDGKGSVKQNAVKTKQLLPLVNGILIKVASLAIQPIELKVPMCCEKCAKKVKDRLLDLDGVESVVTDQYHQKVTVYGPTLDPARVLRRVKLVKKRSAFWDLTVDYSENYRRYQAENAAAAAAKSKSKSQAKLVAPLRSDHVVQLPQERDGPLVSAILQEERVPFIADSRIHSVRYVSPPKAYRQERFFNGRYEDRPGY